MSLLHSLKEWQVAASGPRGRGVADHTGKLRCWVHKTAKVLNALPQSLQVKVGLQEIWMSPTKAQAETVLDRLVRDFGVKYPKATAKLSKDRETLNEYLRVSRLTPFLWRRFVQ